MFPHLFGLGADRIVVQQRDDTGRGLHLLEHFLHPRRLAVGDDRLHCRIALHHRIADQGRGDEHVVVEPMGQNRRHRMTKRRRTREGGCLAGTAAAAGKRPAAAARRDRLNKPVLDLFDKRAVRGPFRVPQPRRRMHCRCDPEALQFGPERVIIGVIEIAVFDEHRPDEDRSDRLDPRHTLQFLEREIHVLQRQYGGGEQPLRRHLAEIGDPVVVGACQRVGHVGIAHQEEAFGEPGRV